MDDSAVLQALRDPARLGALRALGLLDAPPDPALERLARLAARLLRAPVSLIALADADSQQIVGGVGLPGRWRGGRRIPLAHSLCQHVVAGRAPLAVPDARGWATVAERAAIPDRELAAYAGVPLIAPTGEALGALCAIDSAPRAWDAGDLALLTDLAGAAVAEIARRRAARPPEAAPGRGAEATALGALAEENAQLYVAERASRLEAERAAARISRLYAVTAALAEARRPAQVAEIVVGQGISALGAYAGALMLREPDGRRLTLARAVGYPPEVVAAWPSQTIDDPFPIAEAVRDGQPVWIHTRADVGARYPRFIFAPSSQTQAFAVVPLLIDGYAIAAIGLSFDAPQAFPDEDRAFMLALADQCAQALDRARLLDSLQRELAERQRAEAALRDNEARLDGILRSAMDAIITVNSEQRIVRFNHAAEQLFGYRAEELLGQPLERLIPPRFHAAHRSFIPAFGATGVTSRAMGALTPLAASRADGSEFPIEAAISHVEVAGEHWYTVILRDISARLAAVAALRESEARFTAFMDRVPAGCWICGADGVIRYVNAAYRALFPPALADDDHALNLAVLEHGQPQEAVAARARVDGSPGQFLVYRFPLATGGADPLVGGIAIDITERAAAEEQRRALERSLLETQKLESLGVLAGGIAHDFNNLLVAILGNIELALLDLEEQHPAYESVRQIGIASRRAAELTHQLLAYSGRGRLVIEPIDLNALVQELALLLRASVPKGVSLEYELAPGLPAVEGDATQLRQVVMNLAINGAEAMGAAGGQVVLRTALREVDADFLATCTHTPDVPAGLYVLIEVADTGCGMDEATMGRVFEPFFTSKFAGRGLGMAAVLGIVRGHRGAIQLTSAPGAGTTIRVLLPPTVASPGQPAPPQYPARPASVVLVIDDEPEVRAVTARMLERLGCAAVLADSGRAGLEQLAACPEVRGVLLDLTMPGLSGEETLRELRQRRADLPVIVVSGYSASEVHTRIDDVGAVEVLQKPFTLIALSAALDRALHPRPAR